MNSLLSGLTFASALGCGLMAGVFFAFSTFVMTALSRLPAAQGIAAMQSINSTIVTTLFLFVFMVTALLSLVLGVIACFKWGTPGAIYLLAGGVLYVVGAFLVTVACNVPLNDALAAASPTSPEGAALWTRYLSDWVAWNHVRTLASLAALAAYIVALRQ
ncbi:UNVERIFIED_CONTAM: putative membrane protein [Brevibacillus sp. OAP136]